MSRCFHSFFVFDQLLHLNNYYTFFNPDSCRDGRFSKIIRTISGFPSKLSRRPEEEKNYNNYKKNPATKTFQAIRIFVNQELTELILGLIAATKLLADGGILVVVSFHSLEDKIVKYFFSLYSNLRNNPSRYLPLNNNKPGLFGLLSKKPLTPSKKEIYRNIRSRSAKLRYAVRNNNSFFYPKEFKKKFENFFNVEGIAV